MSFLRPLMHSPERSEPYDGARQLCGHAFPPGFGGETTVILHVDG
jgi:hypothetical protein